MTIRVKLPSLLLLSAPPRTFRILSEAARGHFYSFTLSISFLTLAVAALVLRLAASGGAKPPFRARSTRV